MRSRFIIGLRARAPSNPGRCHPDQSKRYCYVKSSTRVGLHISPEGSSRSIDWGSSGKRIRIIDSSFSQREKKRRMLHRRDEEVRKARGIGFRSELGNRVDNSIVVWSLDTLPRMRWSSSDSRPSIIGL